MFGFSLADWIFCGVILRGCGLLATTSLAKKQSKG